MKNNSEDTYTFLETPEDKAKYKVNWTVNILVVILGAVIGWKIINSKFVFDLTSFKFTDLLSLVVSLFAIWLSILFYFKATETSNTFYNNTFKFTKDISEILGRIEAGFGERLRHLDEGYSGLRDQFYNDKKTDSKIEKAKEEIASEEEKAKNAENERQRIIEHLLEQANIQQAERENILTKLGESDTELEKSRKEIYFLRKKLDQSEMERNIYGSIPPTIVQIFRHELNSGEHLTRGMIKDAPLSLIRRRFKQLYESFIDDIKEALLSSRIVDSDGDLTPFGFDVLRQISKL